MKKPRTCPRKSRTFTVVQIGGDKTDAHAARTLTQARDLANPDVGDVMTIFKVCAKDAGEARTLHMAGRSAYVKRAKAK